MNSGKMLIKLLGIIVFVGGINFFADAMNEDQSLYPKNYNAQPYKPSQYRTSRTKIVNAKKADIKKEKRIAARKEKERLKKQEMEKKVDDQYGQLKRKFDEIDTYELAVQEPSVNKRKFIIEEDDNDDLDFSKDLPAAESRQELKSAQQERRQQRDILHKHTATPMVRKGKKRNVPVSAILELDECFNNGDMDKVNEMLQDPDVRAAVQGFDYYYATRPETETLNENMRIAKEMIAEMLAEKRRKWRY